MGRALFFLFLVLAAALGCEEAKPVSQRSGIPPWHMWGNTQTIEGSDTFAVNTPGVNGQLLRISYLRPETWRWVFFARLLEAREAAPGESLSVGVSFNLTMGIGRSQITIPNFEQFSWNWGAAGPARAAPLNYFKYSTAVNGRMRIDFAELFVPAGTQDPWLIPPGPSGGSPPNGPTAARSLGNHIDQIVAQDIQLDCVVTVSTFGGPLTAKVEVSAQFSPNVHVRPEWFKDGRYPGAEDGGSEAGSVQKQLEQLNQAKPGAEPQEADDDGRGELYTPDDHELLRNRQAIERLDRTPSYDPDYPDDDPGPLPPPRPSRRRG